jgi:hypothetical protein
MCTTAEFFIRLPDPLNHHHRKDHEQDENGDNSLKTGWRRLEFLPAVSSKHCPRQRSIQSRHNIISEISQKLGDHAVW